jgi:hypothetical protein
VAASARTLHGVIVAGAVFFYADVDATQVTAGPAIAAVSFTPNVVTKAWN